MNPTRRISHVAPRALVAASVMAAALISGASSASAEPVEDDATLALINQTRVAVGVCPLVLDVGVDVIADQWSAGLGASGGLAHNVAVIDAGNVVSENVGYGASVDEVEGVFLDSPLHYANIVDPVATGVGIGVSHVGERTYLTYDFTNTSPRAC